MFHQHHQDPGDEPRFDIQTASDLRRRIPRDLADLLVLRAEHLLPDDRALIAAIYRDNLTAAQVADLLDTSPRAIRRRIRAIVQRLLSPRYEFVAQRRQQWGPTRYKVAEACVLEGRTLRDAAAHLRLSLHTVRRHMDAVAAQQEALRA